MNALPHDDWSDRETRPQGSRQHQHVAIRMGRWLQVTFRPFLGWTVLIACFALTILPAFALRENHWMQLGRSQAILEFTGPLAVATVWYLLGWRKSHPTAGRHWLRVLVNATALLLIGLLLFSQLLFGWLPELRNLWLAASTNSWGPLGGEIVGEWRGVATRFELWWQGVRSGGAAQDNLIFTVMAGFVLYVVGSITAFLARKYRQGFLAAIPSLWLLGAILMYSSVGRSLLVFGLGLAVLLQLMLDHEGLLERWQSLGLDYHPGVLIDRLFAVLGVALLVLALAAITPNLRVEAIVTRYYTVTAPINQALEDFADRLFPDVRGTSRLRGGGLSGGLPNEFLLSAGPDLGGAEVMRVRTNESAYSDYPFDDAPPPGHYMRSATLTDYDGLGWRNPATITRQDVAANERWWSDSGDGRKLVVQSVILLFNTQVIFAAPEPIEVSVDYQVEERASGDIVALRGRERSYTVVSSVPAVDDDMLRALPQWRFDIDLPEEYRNHLELPDTITDRTRELARELAQTSDNPFDRVQALEAFLRTYEYDLTVPEPPDDVVDVADFFLFDLQRGYCDYYATAFVVLARLMGLPTRFATGFAVGHWDPREGVWIVTEAEAHSWPEVFFPEVGWIPFEPTAGRPQLTRVAAPQLPSMDFTTVQQNFEALSEPAPAWSWQALIWLLPFGLLVWGAFAWYARLRARREDPWHGLLRWGGRLGRPISAGETVMEYGDGLADYVVLENDREPSTARVVASEVRGLSRAMSNSQYGPASVHSTAVIAASEHWGRLRSYIRSFHVRKH